MGMLADLNAYAMQRGASRTVRYGDTLYFAGSDFVPPTQIHVPTRHGPVRCDVYRPRHRHPRPPVYVHLHGGAFIMRYPMMDDFFARYVAAECGAVVVNVDYDVAPQARYPVAHHQAHDVAAWVGVHGDDLGVDGSRVAVGGFSTGGSLAASACLQARDLGSFRPVLQMLGVPSLDVAEDVWTKTARRPHAMVSPKLLKLVRSTYFRDVATRAHPYASPLLADDLAGLPPAVVLTAEYDVLRDEGDRYAARLSDAGVHVVHEVVGRVDHHFLDGDRTQARATLALIAQHLTKAFAPVP